MKLKILGLIVLTALVIIGSASLTYSEINKYSVEGRIIAELKNVRLAALNCREKLTQSMNRLEDVKTQYNAKIDTADKTTISSYPAEIEKTIKQVNALIIKIDTDFPSIQLSNTR